MQLKPCVLFYIVLFYINVAVTRCIKSVGTLRQSVVPAQGPYEVLRVAPSTAVASAMSTENQPLEIELSTINRS